MPGYRLLLESGAGFLLESGSGVVLLEASGAPTAATFRETLLAKLASIPPLAALIGGSIFPGALPEGHDLSRDGPALTYVVATYPRGHVLAGRDGTASARVQLDAWSYLESDSDAIALAVRDALDGPPANPWIPGGVAIMSVSHRDETDLPEPPRAGSDRWTYRVFSEYLIKHRTV